MLLPYKLSEQTLEPGAVLALPCFGEAGDQAGDQAGLRAELSSFPAQWGWQGCAQGACGTALG